MPYIKTGGDKIILEKKEGIINGIVYEHTVYRNGKYRLYPTITDLNTLIDKLIEANTTTEYIRITPFYVNKKVNLQREFDQYMFFVECMEQFNEQDAEDRILESLDMDATSVTLEEYDRGKILTPICRYDDSESFKASLDKYRDYLDVLLPCLFDYAKVDLELSEKDLAFGYFCFEIHSE